MNPFEKTILITGGMGFIGSHLVNRMVRQFPNYQIVNVDALTYAANPENVAAVATCKNYVFAKGDIADASFLEALFEKYAFENVIHLAAESHVDKSISAPMNFAKTNVMGTLTLLEAVRKQWQKNREGKLFYHISTDEVFGSLGDTGIFDENSCYDPRSPYAASKAASDHFVRAYYHTYGLPIVISNCSNNYGPHQFPEKLIPLFIKNIVENKPLPVYGDGKNVRDWLFVEDHVDAIELIFHKGRIGETYAIGGTNEIRNIDMVAMLIKITDSLLDRPEGTSENLIRYVTDRAGHDYRYAIDSEKITSLLGWKPKTPFEQGIQKTVAWYLQRFKTSS